MVNLTRRIAVLSVMALVIGMGSLFAQSDRGTITGTVNDSSGARVAGAAVTITSAGTNISTKATSNTDGNYTFTNVQIGVYSITVEHPGFKKYSQQGISLTTGQTLGIDVVLQVGNVTETVQVTSEAPQLEAETTSLGTTATATLVQDLPLVSDGEMRNPGFFMVLDSSVSSRGASFGGGGGFNDRSLSTTVAGAPSASAEFHVDGSILTTGEDVHADFRVIGFPQDAVQEFKLSTVGMPAELGHTGGGITAFTLKSGTNQLHGNAYDYLRNNALDARGFISPSTTPLHQNEFGGTVGGPILKNKLFFYAWYDGFRIHTQASNSLATVPEQAFRQGNFAGFETQQGMPVTIYNPYSNNGLNVARTAFPGNVINIPLDTVGQAITSYIPAPSGPFASSQYSNYLVQGAAGTQQDEGGGKINYQLSTKNTLTGSFSYSDESLAAAASPIAGPLSETAPGIYTLPVARLSDDYLVSPNIENHITLGFNRWNTGSPPFNQVAGGWPAKLGYKGVPLSDGAMPIINGFDGLGQFGGAGGNPSATIFNNSDINESLSWIHGKHSFKFGMEYLKEEVNQYGSGRASGYLFTSNNFTANPLDPNYNTSNAGSGFASFLLGQMDSGQTYIYYAPIMAARLGYWSGYAQDDWKISSKLTANIGVRWDRYEPSNDANNHESWMTPTITNPYAGGLAGAIQFATPGQRAGDYAQKFDFTPRIGLAYQLNSKTVVRASYGILTAPGPMSGSRSGHLIQGFNIIQNLQSTNNDLTPTWTLAGGWPFASLPSAENLSAGTGIGTGVARVDPQDGHSPYMQQRVLQIERQLPSNILLKVAYTGNTGIHLQSRIDVNNEMAPWDMSLTIPDPTNEGLGANGTGLLPAFLEPLTDPRVQALPIVKAMPVDPGTGNHSPFKGFEGVYGGGVQLGQALRPFPQYTEMIRLSEGDGTSDYNALKVDLDKRMSNGLTLLVSYTWEKTLTNAASEFNEFSGYDQNSYNARAQKGLSLNDYPQNLVLTYSYELPFGPGKKYLQTGGVAGRIVGGWKIAGVQNYQSGPPQIYTQGCTTGGFEGNGDNGGGFNCRPNIVPGVPQRNPAVTTKGQLLQTNIANPALFQLTPNPMQHPGLGYQSYFGDAPPLMGGPLRRSAYFDEDISLVKKTQVNERINVEFRADFLNIFNRTVLGFGTGGDMYGSSLFNQAPGLGPIITQSNTPREIQFGLKINY